MPLKNSALTILVAGAVMTSGVAAHAQAVGFAEIDSDNDGILQAEEISETFGGDILADVLMLYDRDGNGEVDASEAKKVSEVGARNAAAGMRKAAENRERAQALAEAAQAEGEDAEKSGRPDDAGRPEGSGRPGGTGKPEAVGRD